ncbi:MAG: IclR family transcriptional regulator [Spirochaetales bacterium]|nr:IclR family transcriptional regulator [Spirochaetales bacterium]
MFQDVDDCSDIDTKSYSLATTVQKAFRILECIGKNQPVKAPFIVKKLDLTRGNVHRLLITLEALGYVERSEEGTYALTYKMFALGNTVPKSTRLDEIARPFMRKLSEYIRENVYLSVLHRDSIVVLDKVRHPRAVSIDRDIELIYPLHASASGKVFLAAMDDEELYAHIERLHMDKRAANTKDNEADLLKDIMKVRQRGYALDIKEYSDDIHSVSAPIFDYEENLVACLAISAPSVRLTEEKLMETVKPLLETAGAISEKIGSQVKGNAHYKMIKRPIRSSKPFFRSEGFMDG